MYVNPAQKFFTYMGYYANAFARQSARDIERLTRPMPQGDAYYGECVERAKRAVSAVFSLPLAGALFIPAVASYITAACVGRGRFELIEPKTKEDFQYRYSLKVAAHNACFQDPWSPLTGGVVPPFEAVDKYPSRIAATVAAIAERDPDVYLGQEFENLGAQDECIRLMQKAGFRYFVRDLGSNDAVRNNSGLFVASKLPLRNIRFLPYPLEDRTGLAKWSGQGALVFTVEGKNLRFINTHLNYGDGEENQKARNRQLKRRVLPLLNEHPSVLFGDLNFNTASVDRKISGLRELLVNPLEGTPTCTDSGKHTLRGKSKKSEGQTHKCEESIDGIIYDPYIVEVLDPLAEPLLCNNQLLSDHSLITATVHPRPITYGC